MTERAFDAMGGEWWVSTDRGDLLDGAVAEVEKIEAALSRFRPDSALSRLNRERTCEDPILACVAAAAIRARQETDGAFDPTLGDELTAWGYGAPLDTLAGRRGRAPTGRSVLVVDVSGNRVRLHGRGSLDLGGIGKGWAVDQLVVWLRAAGAKAGLVDGAGDLRGFGPPWAIGLPDGGAIELVDAAVATSSTLERRWFAEDGRLVHHLLDPATGAPVLGPVHTVTTTARTATQAETWAKAILVRPELAERFERPGQTAWLGDDEGRWWTSNPGAVAC